MDLDFSTIRSEDFIEFYLFPDINHGQNEVENKDEVLENLLKQVNEIASVYCSNYIFHKESFKIQKNESSIHLLIDQENDNVKEILPPHLYGSMNFGDNIQDEWFIVSLLFKLSREIPGLVIRTIDSDGEFMLIEAADHLPNWANPNTCKQRVYIYNGHIHLVHDTQSNPKVLISVNDAIKKIRENSNKYLATETLETCILERIKNFPENIKENFHRQVVYVPLGVAALLNDNPQLIAPAVLAFCNRDPIDMKVCRAMRFFPPENRVYTNVLFTKCLYAMLLHNKYLPDRRTGWNLPSSNSPHYKAHLLGVKLACGFEILASQAKSPSGNITDDREWKVFIDSLTKKNYFQGNLEGSKDYTKLLDAAKNYYQENRDSMKMSQVIGDNILKKLKNLEYSYEEYKKKELTLPDSDDDSWLNVDPLELDEMLQKRYGIKNILSPDANANPANLTELLSDFLEKESEYEGVDLNENVPAPAQNQFNVRLQDPPLSASPLHLPGTTQNNNNKIDFDPDGFSQQVQNLLDLIIPEDKWESNSDMSDYSDDDDLLAKNIDDIAKKAKAKDNKDFDLYMEQMDRELAKTTIGQSFEKKTEHLDSDDFDDIEDFKPVNIDMNAIKNMYESYNLQGAAAGPTSNLLASILNKDNNKSKTTDV